MTDPHINDLFLRACRREPTERVPIWLMRQAGRYLPEYRALRTKHDFLAMTQQPELAAEVTLQPIRRFGFDAAILFADIVTPLIGHGIEIGWHRAFIVNPLAQRGASIDDVDRQLVEDIFVGKIAPQRIIWIEATDCL